MHIQTLCENDLNQFLTKIEFENGALDRMPILFDKVL